MRDSEKAGELFAVERLHLKPLQGWIPEVYRPASSAWSISKDMSR
jgi:hypothetical protein